MRKTSFFLKSFAVILLFAWALSGCSFPEWHSLNIVVGGVRAGMVGSSLPGRISYSYRTFTGYESSLLNAEPGQAVTIQYDFQIDKGVLNLEIQNKSGDVLWRKEFSEDSQGIDEVNINESGFNRVVVKAKDAGGSFDVFWQAK